VFGSDRFIQDLSYSAFGSDRIRFIQGSVQTGLYRILFYLGFGKDRFIEDSVLFRVR
jgi:hypothetical protein